MAYIPRRPAKTVLHENAFATVVLAMLQPSALSGNRSLVRPNGSGKDGAPMPESRCPQLDLIDRGLTEVYRSLDQSGRPDSKAAVAANREIERLHGARCDPSLSLPGLQGSVGESRT